MNSKSSIVDEIMKEFGSIAAVVKVALQHDVRYFEKENAPNLDDSKHELTVGKLHSKVQFVKGKNKGKEGELVDFLGYGEDKKYPKGQAEVKIDSKLYKGTLDEIDVGGRKARS